MPFVLNLVREGELRIDVKLCSILKSLFSEKNFLQLLNLNWIWLEIQLEAFTWLTNYTI